MERLIDEITVMLKTLQSIKYRRSYNVYTILSSTTSVFHIKMWWILVSGEFCWKINKIYDTLLYNIIFIVNTCMSVCLPQARTCMCNRYHSDFLFRSVGTCRGLWRSHNKQAFSTNHSHTLNVPHSSASYFSLLLSK